MIILHNGRIGVKESPLRTAIAIENDRIVASGSDDDVLNLATANIVSINLGGKTVWPGLTDSHLHLELLGKQLCSVDCAASTRDECLSRVNGKVQQSASEEWILGNGWNQNHWQGGYGTAAELDAVSAGHPVLLRDQSLHSAWVNSRVLQIAGIGRLTPDPVGGIIRRDSKGDPTGVLHESAVQLVDRVIPLSSPETRREEMKAAQRYLNSFGITTVNDFDPLTCHETLCELQQTDELFLRVVKGIPFDKLDWAIENCIHTGFGNDFIKWGWIKLFADGALGPQTAAMIQPYETNPENYGTLLLTSEEILEYGIKTVTHGLSLAIHAIGDQAVREVLHGYAKLRDYEDQHQIHVHDHRIEHLQVIHPDDIRLLSDCRVIASMQPIHLITDMQTAEKHWGERSIYAYAFATISKLCRSLAFGSDAPVESPNPFLGLSAAVTRQQRHGENHLECWHPDELITIHDAVKAYTPPGSGLLGKSCNGLNLGDLADIIILEKDPLLMDPFELIDVLPERVMFAGHWIT